MYTRSRFLLPVAPAKEIYRVCGGGGAACIRHTHRHMRKDLMHAHTHKGIRVWGLGLRA